MDKRRVGVRAIIYKDGKILAVKHKRKNGEEREYWALPGGGLDPGEHLEAGLQREIEEELGVGARVGRLLFIQQFKSIRADRDEELEFFFLIENSEDFTEIDYSSTTHGAAELARCEFIDPKAEYVLPRFISEVDMGSHTETVQPVVVSDMLNE